MNKTTDLDIFFLIHCFHVYEKSVLGLANSDLIVIGQELLRSLAQFASIDEGAIGAAVLNEGKGASCRFVASQFEMHFGIRFVKRVRVHVTFRRSFRLLQN